jgi:hypothetical protein
MTAHAPRFDQQGRHRRRDSLVQRGDGWCSIACPVGLRDRWSCKYPQCLHVHCWLACVETRKQRLFVEAIGARLLVRVMVTLSVSKRTKKKRALMIDNFIKKICPQSLTHLNVFHLWEPQGVSSWPRKVVSSWDS